MRHLLRKSGPLAAATALALIVAACGGSGEPAAQETSQTTAETAPATSAPESVPAETEQEATGTDPFSAAKAAAAHVGDNGSAKAIAAGVAAAAGLEGDIESPAAQAYTSLSTLLQEHVYLAGYAVDTGVSFGLDSPEFEAAAAALDENSVELSELVGSVAGDENGQAFLDLWRQHIGFFVDYAQGLATEDQELQQQAQDNLDQYQQDAGALFEDVTGGEIPANAVVESLEGHIATLNAAIEAAVAGDGSVFSKLKEAATHVGEQGSAKALATGIATAAGLEGDPAAPAVQAYASLSTLLEEHVYLSGLAVKTAYTAGADSPAFEAASSALDENSVELSEVVGSVAGDGKGQAFLDLWRQHIGFFVDYAKGAAGDEELQQQALDNLNQYRRDAGAFFEDITGGELPADAVAQSLTGHIETVTTAIDALAAVLVS